VVGVTEPFRNGKTREYARNAEPMFCWDHPHWHFSVPPLFCNLILMLPLRSAAGCIPTASAALQACGAESKINKRFHSPIGRIAAGMHLSHNALQVLSCIGEAVSAVLQVGLQCI